MRGVLVVGSNRAVCLWVRGVYCGAVVLARFRHFVRFAEALAVTSD